MVHLLDHLQPGKLLAFLLLQRIIDRIHQITVHRNRDILKRIRPLLRLKQNDLTYSFSTTAESIDIAREAFREVKDLTIKLSMIENSAYRPFRPLFLTGQQRAWLLLMTFRRVNSSRSFSSSAFVRQPHRAGSVQRPV